MLMGIMLFVSRRRPTAFATRRPEGFAGYSDLRDWPRVNSLKTQGVRARELQRFAINILPELVGQKPKFLGELQGRLEARFYSSRSAFSGSILADRRAGT
jgi:hypothetical protein